jgi:hypothetical protein
VAWKTAGTTQLEVCTRCGGFAHQLKIARGEVEPFGVRALLAAARWPFSPVGLLCIAASTSLATVLGFAGAKGTAIATGVIVAYLFQIVRHTARGGDDFPASAAREAGAGAHRALALAPRRRVRRDGESHRPERR